MDHKSVALLSNHSRSLYQHSTLVDYTIRDVHDAAIIDNTRGGRFFAFSDHQPFRSKYSIPQLPHLTTCAMYTQTG